MSAIRSSILLNAIATINAANTAITSFDGVAIGLNNPSTGKFTTLTTTGIITSIGTTEQLRLQGDGAYIGFFNTGGATRTGYIQGNSSANMTWAAENGATHVFNVGGSTIHTITATGITITGNVTTSFAGSYFVTEDGGSARSVLSMSAAEIVTLGNANNNLKLIGAAGIVDLTATGLAVTGALSATGVLTITKATGGQTVANSSGNTTGTYQSFGTSAGTKGYIGLADQLVSGGSVNDIGFDGFAGNIIFATASTTRATVSSTGLAVTGTLSATEVISGTATGSALTLQGATTAARYIAVANTTGQILVGVENSTGAAFAATAYDSVIQAATSTGLSLVINGTGVIGRFSSTGLAVTGTLSATGVVSIPIASATDGLIISASRNARGFMVYSDTGGVSVGSTTAHNFNALVNNAVIGAFSSSGLAITGTMSATGLISTTGTGVVFSSTGASITQRYLNFANTSASLVLGIESSAGGTLLTAGTAYACVFNSVNAQPFMVGIGGTLISTFSSTGLAVTGALTVSANVANVAALFTQASATGYGVKIKPGVDTNYALGITNAADSLVNISLFGNGNATFAGSITTTAGQFNFGYCYARYDGLLSLANSTNTGSKFLRTSGTTFEIVNNAYTTVVFSVSDTGALAATGAISTTVGSTTTVCTASGGTSILGNTAAGSTQIYANNAVAGTFSTTGLSVAGAINSTTNFYGTAAGQTLFYNNSTTQSIGLQGGTAGARIQLFGSASGASNEVYTDATTHYYRSVSGGTTFMTLNSTGLNVTGTIVATVGTLGSNGVRACTISTSAPSGGSDGDIWYRY